MEYLNNLNYYSITGLILFSFLFSYAIQEKKNFLVPFINVIIVSILSVFSISNKTYLLLIAYLVYFVIKIEKTRAKNFILLVCLVISLITQFILNCNCLYILIALNVVVLIFSISNRSKNIFHFILLMEIALCSIQLFTTQNVYQLIILSYELLLITTNSNVENKNKIYDLEKYNKIFAKNNLNKKYLCINLFSDESSFITKEERFEIINFLDLCCDNNTVIIYLDDFNYIMMFSDIKVHFGNQIDKVNNNIDALIDQTKILTKNRFAFPIVSETKRIFNIDYLVTEDFEEAKVFGKLKLEENLAELKKDSKKNKLKGI